MIGKVFGEWTVIKYAGKKEDVRSKLWLCRCECGQERKFTTSYLNTHRSKCCQECLKKKAKKKEKEICKEYIGRKIGTYTVIGYLGKDKWGSRGWLAKCKCGNERKIKTSHITGKCKVKINECMRCRLERIEGENRIIEGEIPDRFWDRLIQHAERRKIKVTITKKYAYDLYISQNKKCKYSGDDLYFTKLRTNYSRYTTASLDRIDSRKPYEEGNVQWVHKKINMMKQQYSHDDFINMCKKVASYSEGERNAFQCRFTLRDRFTQGLRGFCNSWFI